MTNPKNCFLLNFSYKNSKLLLPLIYKLKKEEKELLKIIIIVIIFQLYCSHFL